MKKVLIIQRDEAYFLFETLQIIDSQWSSFSQNELHLLINPLELEKLKFPIRPNITIHSDVESIKDIDFQESYNLSLNETSWREHSQVKAVRKRGPYFTEGNLVVRDLWSTYLMTLKARAPFITFHLRDIYRQILELGIPTLENKESRYIEKIIFSPLPTSTFKAEEQEKFILELSQDFPSIPIVDLSEVKDVSDLSNSLYIGPLDLNGCQLVSRGAKGFFLQTHFQGMNFIPYREGQIIVSSEGNYFQAKHLKAILEGAFKGKYKADIPYSVYITERESSSNLFLKPHIKTDSSYPLYQSHFILWNFLLNLEDVNLPAHFPKDDQKVLLQENTNVIKKLSSLQGYALEAINHILKQAKAKLIETNKLEANFEIIRDYDQTAQNIAKSHPYLRPLIDFYHIRKGQSSAFTLQEQAEESLLIYHEEQQALSALHELFSVTLNKNEAKI